MKLKYLIFIFTIITTATGCTKLVEVDPPVTSTNAENVYKSDATSIAVLTGIYTKLSLSEGNFLAGSSGLTFYAGLSADELTLFSGASRVDWMSYYGNTLSTATGGFELWISAYNYIFKCNAAIEGLTNSITLTPAIKNQLLGEAKFLRGLFYFYLTNFYGDVPLVLTTDYAQNAQLSKTPQANVYAQIITDLKDAQVMLSEEYLGPTLLSAVPERVRPTKWAAAALLARVYLYTADWANAEMQSTIMISNPLFELSNIDNVFLKSSLGNKESIWELQPVNTGWNTEDARLFVINEAPGSTKPVHLNAALVESFGPSDQRKTRWTKDTTINAENYTYPYKYKYATQNDPVNEHMIVFRLAEQYLIRAEAKAQLDKLNEAQDDLNAIRNRAGLNDTAISNKASLLSAILNERRFELFTEMGHRWLDLKRTELIDQVMNIATPLKGQGNSWQSFQSLYPLPISEIQRNRNLIQNTGY